MYASIDQVIARSHSRCASTRRKIMRSTGPQQVVQHLDEQVLSIDGFDDHEESEPTVIHSRNTP